MAQDDLESVTNVLKMRFYGKKNARVDDYAGF